jgi:hypothetical protein
MKKELILFKDKNSPRSQGEIKGEITKFKDDYVNTTRDLILDSAELDEDGKIFVKNGSLILSKFGMTRGGPFAVKETTKATLSRCWEETGESLMNIKRVLYGSGYPRERLLVDIERESFESLIDDIWDAMKRMLPFTMGATSYGLVGASKLLFAVFPEIVLPIDNAQWLKVFQTVDIRDVISWMASDIQRWEDFTGEKLNELDKSGRLSTLPSVYNVMAMAARNY